MRIGQNALFYLLPAPSVIGSLLVAADSSPKGGARFKYSSYKQENLPPPEGEVAYLTVREDMTERVRTDRLKTIRLATLKIHLDFFQLF